MDQSLLTIPPWISIPTSQKLTATGIALKDKGNLSAAISSFSTALELKQYPDAYNNLGLTLREKGDLDEALLNHERALELDPKDSKAFYGIGLIQAVRGNLKDSKNSFTNAIELNPDNTAVLLELSKIIESSKDTKDLYRRLNGVSRGVLNRKDETMLEFALANFHHKSKNYFEAAQHLCKANKLKLYSYPSNLSNLLLQANKTIALASK